MFIGFPYIFFVRCKDEGDAVNEGDNASAGPSQPKRQRTLMDFARAEQSWPCYKHVDQVPSLEQYINNSVQGIDNNSAIDYLEAIITNSRIQSKVLLYDALIILCKKNCCGVSAVNVDSFQKLLTAMRDLFWYISPHHLKFASHGASFPTFFNPLQGFNNPSRYKNKPEKIHRQVILSLVGAVTNLLEKSFVSRNSFSTLHKQFDSLVECCVKYSDYLETNLCAVTEYQEQEESTIPVKLTAVPLLQEKIPNVYTSHRDKIFIEAIIDHLEIADFYEEIEIGKYLPQLKAHRYSCLRNFKSKGMPINGVMLYTKQYGPANGFIHFLWKEEADVDLTARQNTIERITQQLPKYSSRAYKKRVQTITSLIMEDKITSSQFRVIFQELIGDQSSADNRVCKAADERIKLILKTADESIIRDLRKNNGAKNHFDAFWTITEQKINELQASAVNDRRHADSTHNGQDIVTNMSIAISARDLYERCVHEAKEEGLNDEGIPSLSWFRFQFWPKNPYTHSALNYTGRLAIRYMVQQRNIRKFSEDDHYCNALYKYAREIAIRFKDFTAFISTDDKNKIKVGEPDCPIAAVTRGKKVLVAHGHVVQAADHDFSSITLTPTVVLLNDVPNTVDDSWYRGQPFVYIKITATEPSTALRNAVEIENALIKKHGSKANIPPIIILYTDGGPEHRTNFLSVKIAASFLFLSLNPDMLLHLRTAPGHSYRNPPERVNCILNLGLYGMGVMRSKIINHPQFEHKLSQCSNLSDVRNLLKENEEVNTNLLKQSCRVKATVKSFCMIF